MPHRNAIVLALLLLAACGGPEGPAATARLWLEHLEKGAFAEAFAQLSPATQAQLESLAATEAPPPRDADDDRSPALRLFTERVAPEALGGVAPLPAATADLVLEATPSEDPGIAWVHTRNPAGPRDGPGSEATLRLRLVQVAEGWRVDLHVPAPGGVGARSGAR